MSVPVLFAVDEDPALLGAVERELADRYARGYRVATASSSEEALRALGSLNDAGEEVALVLAAQWLAGMTGSELLGRARALHPHAQRGPTRPARRRCTWLNTRAG